MVTKEEALKLALDALEYMDGHYLSLPQQGMQALTAVKEALAQPAQEPCTHRIADARNRYVKSGYFCLDCGMLFSAADHFDQPAAQSAQEPVATFDVAVNDRTAAINYDHRKHKLISGTKLYTTPPQRKENK